MEHVGYNYVAGKMDVHFDKRTYFSWNRCQAVQAFTVASHSTQVPGGGNPGVGNPEDSI